MKKKIFLLAMLVISICILPSCKKKKGCTDINSISYDNEAEVVDGSCKVAGAGGNVTLVARPQHHGTPILNTASYPDTAYLKFNTQDSPGYNPSSFDLVVPGIHIGEDHVEVEGLRPGKYFIMMTGFDTTINERVIGGIPLIITAEFGEVVLNVPVVE